MIPRTTVDIGEEEIQAAIRVIKSGQFVKGPEAKALEQEFAAYQGVKYGVSVNSGTSALHLSLLMYNLNKNDEVILPPNTFAATINAIIHAGGKPVFADIDPETFTIDPVKVEEKITENTKGIIPVHLYGLMADMKAIQDLASDKNLFVVEDACQAHGAEFEGKRAGSMADIAAFSFFPTKNMTVGGDGGIVLTNNEELATKMSAIRDHGRINEKHVYVGLNYRLSEILAAIGREHLKRLDEQTAHRRKIAKIYTENLSDLEGLVLPIEPANRKHVYHLYTIKTDRRDEFQKFLKENKVGSKVMYEEELNELEYVKELIGYHETPTNNKVGKQILSLPISGSLEEEKIVMATEVIKKFF